MRLDQTVESRTETDWATRNTALRLFLSLRTHSGLAAKRIRGSSLPDSSCLEPLRGTDDMPARFVEYSNISEHNEICEVFEYF